MKSVDMVVAYIYSVSEGRGGMGMRMSKGKPCMRTSVPNVSIK